MSPNIVHHGDGWTIIQSPLCTSNPNLIQFYRYNETRKLLDRTAEWDPGAQVWVSRRWVPRPPKVPLALIHKVVAHMRGQQP